MGLKRLLTKGTSSVMLGAAIACSRSNEPVQVPVHPALARPAASAPVRAVVALPALLGLTVDELAQHLGSPQRVPDWVQTQLASTGPADSTRFFRFRGLDMLVSYDAQTRRLEDLLLLGADEDRLMQRAGLAAEAANYLLLPVFYARRPTQVLGLRVVPISPVSLQ